MIAWSLLLIGSGCVPTATGLLTDGDLPAAGHIELYGGLGGSVHRAPEIEGFGTLNTDAHYWERTEELVLGAGGAVGLGERTAIAGGWTGYFAKERAHVARIELRRRINDSGAPWRIAVIGGGLAYEEEGLGDAGAHVGGVLARPLASGLSPYGGMLVDPVWEVGDDNSSPDSVVFQPAVGCSWRPDDRPWSLGAEIPVFV